MKKSLSAVLAIITILILVFMCSCGEGENNGTKTTEKNDTSLATKGSSAQSGETSQSTQQNAPIYAKEGEMKMRIFKIGKDDAILLRTSGKTVLFDAGQDEKDGAEIAEYLAEKNIKNIDYLVITRFDSNTIGGVPSLLQRVTVSNIIEPSYDKTSEAYTAYTSALASKGLTPEKLAENKTLTVDDVTIKLYKSTITSTVMGKDSAFCTVVTIEHGDNSFFLCSGASAERVDDILKMNDLKHDFLLVPDYGVFDTNTESLFNAVSPKYAAIIDSDKHPADKATCTALETLGVVYYKTSNGSIKITSDKSEIEIEQGSSGE